MVLYAAAVRQDLNDEAAFWQEVTDLASEPPITDVRALDIVAWWAGKQANGQPSPDEEELAVP